MENIYCISGLGADERIFKNISIPGFRLVHLRWPAFDKHDELPCYAQKVAHLIPEKNPNILAVSFGGMLAVEIAKMQPVRRLGLISTAKTREELPPFSGFLKWLMRTRLVPVRLFKTPNFLAYKWFGVENEEQKDVLGAILEDTDRRFAKWAMKALLKWENETVPENVYHIHGKKDKLIVPEGVKANYWIEDGQHFMIYNRAAIINPLLEKYYS